MRVFDCFLSGLMIFLIITAMSSCSSNYQLGDVSKKYCYETNAEFKALIKVALIKGGVGVGIDYCSAYGLVDIAVK